MLGGYGMKKRSVGVILILSLLILFLWTVKQSCFSPGSSAGSTGGEPETVLPSSVNGTDQSGSSAQPAIQQDRAPAPAAENMPAQRQQPGAEDGSITAGGSAVNLSDYDLSIKKKEKQGLEILPGVNVKNKTVHIQLDDSNDKYIEIERGSSNSNNQYQMMLKRKF